MSQPPDIYNSEKSRQTRSVALRVAAYASRAGGLGTVSLVLSVLSGLALLVLVVWGAVDPYSPAFYRGILLAPAGVFTLSVWSVYADKQLFDFETAMIFGFVSFVFDILLLIAEWMRWSNCTELPVINDYICTNYSSEKMIVPIIASIVFILHVIAVAVLIAWRNGWDNYMIKLRRADDIMRDPVLDREIAVDVEEQEEGGEQSERLIAQNAVIGAARRRAQLARRTWADTIIGVLAVLQLLVVYGAAFLALYFTTGSSASAFYRGYLLIVPAMASGFEISFFALVPKRWRVAALILCLLALAAVIDGDVYEIARWRACFGTSGPPIDIVDVDICSDAGWRGLVVPYSVVILSALLFLSFIFVIVRMCQSDIIVDETAGAPPMVGGPDLQQQQQLPLAADDMTPINAKAGSRSRSTLVYPNNARYTNGGADQYAGNTRGGGKRHATRNHY
jgi:hypothetical protein